jgi:hypothetical protein
MLVQVRSLSARRGLIGLVVAIAASLVLVPAASAASFDGGSYTIDFKQLVSGTGAKISSTQATKTTKTGGVFDLGPGSSTMVTNPTGSFKVTGTITIKKGSKKVTLDQIVEKLATGKGTITAVIKTGGKSTSLFTVASPGKVKADSGFVGLTQSKSSVAVSKGGAKALNTALGLKHDQALAGKQKVGTASFKADRKLKVTGGSSKTIYDTAFVDKLTSCDVTLSTLAPATAIPTDPSSAPRGGVDLPVIGGTLNARTLEGSISHDGGTRLFRGDGSPKGAAHTSDVSKFLFGFVTGKVPTLTAFASDINNNLEIGTVAGGTPSLSITEAGGTFTNSGGSLNLGAVAAAALGANFNCSIPEGQPIGKAETTANVS